MDLHVSGIVVFITKTRLLYMVNNKSFVIFYFIFSKEKVEKYFQKFRSITSSSEPAY